MNPSLLIPIFLICVTLGLLYLRKKLLKTIPTVCEYWIYFSGDKLPKIEDVMDRMVKDNPFNRKGRPMIGAREGMVFTDIRMHIGLVKRAKNPKCFRPDLDGVAVIATPENLALLAPLTAFARVRYVSEAQLPDRRHLQFMPHLAGAMADLLNSEAVYDLVSEQLFSKAEFDEVLKAHANLERPDVHIRTEWILSENDQVAFRTFGMPKIGILEHQTLPVPSDQKTLVEEVMMEAIGLAWLNSSWPEDLNLSVQGISFILKSSPNKDGQMLVQIQRLNHS